MTKVPRTVTLDEDVDEYLSGSNINASGLVNQLVRNEMRRGGGSEKLLELRERQLEAELTQVETELETKREQLESIREEREEVVEEEDEILAEAAKTLDRRQLDPDNPAIKNYADKAGLKPAEFVERLEDRF